MSIKLNISYPPFGAQKLIEIDDEKKVRNFYDHPLSTEMQGDSLGDEFKGYVFKIAGGMDKQGFAMKQGVMLNHRTKLVLDGNSGHYRPRRDGCRRRKSVRGCITGPDLSVLNLIIVKKGPQDLQGLTDPASNRPSMRGPKRASNIRKLWGLTKDDDVRQFVSKRKIPGKEGKKDTIKSPKIQRLVTPISLQRKRRRIALKKRRFEKNIKEAKDYKDVITKIRKEKRANILAKKRSISEAKARKEKAAQPKTETTQKTAPKTKQVAATPATTAPKKSEKQTAPAAKTAKTEKQTAPTAKPAATKTEKTATSSSSSSAQPKQQKGAATGAKKGQAKKQ